MTIASRFTLTITQLLNRLPWSENKKPKKLANG